MTLEELRWKYMIVSPEHRDELLDKLESIGFILRANTRYAVHELVIETWGCPNDKGVTSSITKEEGRMHGRREFFDYTLLGFTSIDEKIAEVNNSFRDWYKTKGLWS